MIVPEKAINIVLNQDEEDIDCGGRDCDKCRSVEITGQSIAEGNLTTQLSRSLIPIILILLTIITIVWNNNSKKNLMTEGAKLLFALAHDHFDITTGLGGIIDGPKTFQEGETLKSYLAQCREEIGLRLVDHLYVDEGTKMNKFWMAFARKKFMNKELPEY